MRFKGWTAVLVVTGVWCVTTAVGAQRASVSGRGAATDPAAGRQTMPRTPDGKPSLEGVWNFATMTPLERAASVGGRATYTEEEARLFERQTTERRDMDRRDGGASADLNRAYNDAWYDYGAHLAVIDGVRPTSLITDPPDGRIPPLTLEAQRRAAERTSERRAHPADGPEDRSLSERCLQYNAGPPMLSAPYNNYVEIFQTATAITLFNEMVHDARVVPVDNRPHLPSTVRQFLGDSRGHWDRETFVIDTTNFTNETSFHDSDENLHLTERLTRVDADTLLYQFTIDDPTAFMKPWSAAVPMKLEDTHLYEYACHEGNYALENILRGARTEEHDAGQK